MHTPNNFLAGLPREDLKTFKKRMMGTILATDMTKHAEDFADFKRKLELKGIKKEKANGKLFVEQTNPKTVFES